jgi:tetratricopeptide (TPR) repeat protein/serine/threonine protein kinase
MEKQPAEGFAMDDLSVTAEDPQVLAALKEYQAALDAGTPFDRHKLLDRYPNIAGQLAEVLDALHWVHAAAATVKPLAVDLPAAGQKIGAYRVQAEIGRGGMGVVYRGHDPDLDRWLAIKVLLDEHKDNVVLRRRFLDEARVMGQLQHPGVAPIHDLGQLEDGRPFFSMKQIQGRTLAEVLRSQESGAEPSPADLPHRLDIFEQVCQTVAYAHAQGIIHRDLKPHNVMVGAFGEVQVMDWGLAKQIRTRSETQSPQLETDTAEFATSALGLPPLDSGQAVATTAGTVLGTLAYMAPEQARGEVDRLDERCDVFGLGAILCEILTGQAPFAGGSKMDSHRRATKGDLGETFANLDRCGADGELIQLTKHCLAPGKEDRPGHAGEVARALADYRGSVQARLRQAEIDRAAAVAKAEEERRRREAEQAKAREERRRRRFQLALAACLVVLVVGAGAAGLWYVQDQADRALERAGLDAVKKFARAEAARQAGESLQRARTWMSAGNPALARQELAEAKGRIGNERAALPGLAAEIDALDGALARFQRFFGLIEQANDAETRLTPELAVPATDGRMKPAPAAMRRSAQNPAKAVPFRLQALACYQVLDRDDWFAGLQRDLGQTAQVQQVRRSLYEVLLWLTDDLFRRRQDHRSGQKLSPAEAARQGLAYLHKAKEVWQPTLTFYRLRAHCRRALRQKEAAVADEVLAKDTRPTMAVDHFLLGRAAQAARDKAEAVKQFEEALGLEPAHYWSLMQLGSCLCDLGEGERDFAAAAAVFTGCILRHPDHASAWHVRGIAHEKLRQYDKAVADCSKAIELKPDDPGAWVSRGFAHGKLHQHGKAVANYTKAIELKADFAVAWNNRGMAHWGLRHYDQALADLSKAIALDPGLVKAWSNRAMVHWGLRQYDQAIADLSKAIALRPDYAEAWSSRGNVYNQLGKYDQALADCSKAIELKPDYFEAWCNRGNVYQRLRQYRKAIADFSRAVEVKPDGFEAWYNRGLAHSRLRQYDKAVADCSKAIKLQPDLSQAWGVRGLAHWNLGQRDQAIADYSKLIELKPDDAAVWCLRGNAYYHLGRYDQAIADYSKAIALRSDYAEARSNRGNAYNQLGKYDKALADFSKAIQLDAKYANAHNSLARLLANCLESKLRDPRRAVELAKKATQLEPKNAIYWNALGLAQYRAGGFREALAALEKSMELRKGGNSHDWFVLAMAHWQFGDKDQARQWYHRAVQWMEKNAPQSDELRRFRAEAAELMKQNLPVVGS